MRNPLYVKEYYKRKGTISKWWHPESLDASKNPVRPFRDIYVREKEDVISIIEPEGKIILDAGAGDGRLTMELFKRGAKGVYALDISDEMLKIARKKMKKQSIYDNFGFVQGDIENLGFKENMFDVVVCIHTFVHLPSPSKAIYELAKIIKPGGKLILDITNRNFLYNVAYLRSIPNIISLFKATMGVIAIYFPIGPLRDSGGPFRGYSKEQFEDIIRKSTKNLKIQEVRTYEACKFPIFFLFIINRI